MHEQRHRAKRAEGVGERLLVGGVVALGGLGGLVPALVLGSTELLGDAERAVRIEGMRGCLEVERRLSASLDDLRVRLGLGKVGVADIRGTVEAAAREAVEDVGEKRGLLQRGIDDARVVLDEDVLSGLLVLVRDGRVEGLRVERDGLLVESEREPVGTKLLGGVDVEQLCCHGRFDGARGAGLLVHKEDVVVGDGRVLEKAPVERLPHRRLRHAVEVDVVLADELVDARVLAAPPIAPVVGRVAPAARLGIDVENGLREADRRPEALGPNPHGEAGCALKLGRGDAPVDVSRDAQGQQALAGAEAHARFLEDLARLVARLPVGEGHREGLGVALGLRHGVGRELSGDGVEGLAELVLDVHDRVDERLADGLGHDGTDLGVGVPLVHEGVELRAKCGQVEIPVVNRAQLRRGAGELGHGGDQLLGVELVAEVALVGVRLLGLAPANRAAPDDLASVEELARLDVVELTRGAALQVAALVEAAEQLGREPVVVGTGGLEAGALEDVEADLVGVEGGLLGVVVGADVVGDRAGVALVLDLFAIALHDGGAVAVGAGYEDHVLLADAVAEEPGKEVGGYEDAADVAEVEVLVAVGHAARDDGAFGEGGTVFGHRVAPLRCSRIV